MAKRVDHDATQEVSASMLVPDKRPPAKPPGYGNTPKNDASMWMQAPVSADDFVSAPRKKPVAPGSGGRGLLVAVIVALLVAVGGAGVWYAFLRESPKQTAAYEKPATPSTEAAKPAVAAAVTDAAVAVAAPDATAAPVGDAGMQPGVAALNADAISGADPAVKKTKKRPATKKKPTIKKKTATAPKRR